MKDWTVMIYLAGDNNLSEECIWSIKEMYRAGLNTDDIALVAQIDSRARRMQHFDIGKDLHALRMETLNAANKTYRVVEGNAAPKQVLAANPPPLVSNDGRDGFLSSRGHKVAVAKAKKAGYTTAAASVPTPPDSMATREALTSFIKRSTTEHPAEHYLLILSGHGAGAVGDSFLVDGFPESAFSMGELYGALADAKVQIDVLGMDACSMGMLEVGYQLSELVSFLVAAEGFELNTGWPYDKVLDTLNGNPTIQPAELAAKIVDDYTNYYSDYLMAGVSADLSVCDLTKSKELAGAVDRLAKLLTRNLPTAKGTYRDTAHHTVADALLLAHWRAQSYRFDEHTDIWDFCNLLEGDLNEKGYSDHGVARACVEVKKLIDGTRYAGTTSGYVVKSRHNGGSFQHSHGVSIYFPWATFRTAYSELSFAAATHWGEFLEAYVERTRRLPRAGSGERLPVSREDARTGKRDVIAAGNRDAQTAGNKGDLMVPQVKNPPSHFYQSDLVKPGGRNQK